MRFYLVFCLCFSAACAALLSGAVLADDVIILHDNYLDIVVDDDFALSSTRGPGYHSQAADDFGLSAPLPIQRIHWKGTWVEEEEVEKFRFLFYEDRGDGLAPTGGPSDPTPTAIEQREVTFADAHQGARMENGMTYYYANVYPEVDLDEGQKYWLAIQARHSNHVPAWAWTYLSYNAYPRLEPAVWGYDNTYWQVPTPEATLQFRLVYIPEPSTLAMLGLASAGLLARRRRRRRG